MFSQDHLCFLQFVARLPAMLKGLGIEMPTGSWHSLFVADPFSTKGLVMLIFGFLGCRIASLTSYDSRREGVK